MKRGFFFALVISCTALLAQEPVAVITNATGDVSVLRAQDSVMRSVVKLDELFEGDSLSVTSGEATLLYNSGKIVLLQDSATLYIASTPDSMRGIDDDNTLPEDVRFSVSPLFAADTVTQEILPKFVVRAPDDTLDTPLTIYAPGNTSLSSARPDVIWSCHPCANWYSVVFDMRGEVVINNATTDTLMPFFEMNDDLLPGNYSIRIFAFHDKDTLESQQCSVRILDSVEVETVNRKIRELDEIDADEFTRNFLKALVYEDHTLLVRAIQYYDEMIVLDPDALYPYKALWVLYGKLGLAQQSNTYLEKYESVQTIVK